MELRRVGGGGVAGGPRTEGGGHNLGGHGLIRGTADVWLPIPLMGIK